MKKSGPEINPEDSFEDIANGPVIPAKYTESQSTSENSEEEEIFDDPGMDLDGDESEFYEHHRVKVDPGQGMMRIDVFLCNTLRYASRSRIKKATDAGCLLVNGTQVKASYKIKPADEIVLLLPYPPPPDIAPEDIPVDILFEDEHIAVVNKAAGMVVHPGVGNWYGTLVHAMLYHFNGPVAPRDAENVIWPRLVHRIDKDTSGILLVAKTEDAMFQLSQQFYEHTTDRNYYALVWGNLREDSGTITGHIGRSKKDRKKFAVYTDGSVGKHSITHFEVLERFSMATLVRCKLETGRTHQIRVHMKHIGHTLFGDSTYGGDVILFAPDKSRRYLDFMNECLRMMPRQALHAKTLGFTHPESQERLNFESNLPADFEELLKKLRENRDSKN